MRRPCAPPRPSTRTHRPTPKKTASARCPGPPSPPSSAATSPSTPSSRSSRAPPAGTRCTNCRPARSSCAAPRRAGPAALYDAAAAAERTAVKAADVAVVAAPRPHRGGRGGRRGGRRAARHARRRPAVRHRRLHDHPQEAPRPAAAHEEHPGRGTHPALDITVTPVDADRTQDIRAVLDSMPQGQDPTHRSRLTTRSTGRVADARGLGRRSEMVGVPVGRAHAVGPGEQRGRWTVPVADRDPAGACHGSC